MNMFRLVPMMLALLIAGSPIYAGTSNTAQSVTGKPVPALSTTNQLIRGSTDTLLGTFPLAAGLVGYGWAQSGWAYAGKIFGVDISMGVGLEVLKEAQLPTDPQTGETLKVDLPKTTSYSVGRAAGVGALALLLAYKASSCNESGYAILVKTGLGTLVTRITGNYLLQPLLDKIGMRKIAQPFAHLLKHIVVDTKLTRAIAQEIL